MQLATIDIGVLVAQSYYLQKDFANTRATAEKYTAGVAQPNEQLLLLALRSNFELKDRAATMKTLESLVRYYPQQKYWEDLLTNQLYETKGEALTMSAAPCRANITARPRVRIDSPPTENLR